MIRLWGRVRKGLPDEDSVYNIRSIKVLSLAHDPPGCGRVEDMGIVVSGARCL